jgi:hypothetical protein
MSVEPKPWTAKQIAVMCGWTEAKAKHVLEGLLDRGLAVPWFDDTYLISSLGLRWGELNGIVKPLDPVHGYGEIVEIDKTLDGGLHPFLKNNLPRAK